MVNLKEKMNLPRIACEHVVGKKHTIVHRRIAGGVLSLFGFALIRFGGALFGEYVSWFTEFAGMSLHGLGIIPLFESVE